MQNGTYSVPLKELIEQLDLENCTPDIDTEKVLITQNEVNRPALQLAGYFDYFDSNRIQIIGHVEHTYMQQKGMEHSLKMIEKNNGRKCRIIKASMYYLLQGDMD